MDEDEVDADEHCPGNGRVTETDTQSQVTPTEQIKRRQKEEDLEIGSSRTIELGQDGCGVGWNWTGQQWSGGGNRPERFPLNYTK